MRDRRKMKKTLEIKSIKSIRMVKIITNPFVIRSNEESRLHAGEYYRKEHQEKEEPL